MPTPPPTGPLVTRGTIAAGLRELGVRTGDTLLVHSSLSALGWVCSGPVAVVQALLDVLGPSGTLVVATQTASDPALWCPDRARGWSPVRAGRRTAPGGRARLLVPERSPGPAPGPPMAGTLGGGHGARADEVVRAAPGCRRGERAAGHVPDAARDVLGLLPISAVSDGLRDVLQHGAGCPGATWASSPWGGRGPRGGRKVLPLGVGTHARDRPS
ncbi:hypothetical protein STENM327S_00115 [Streptomyces tendae]